MESVLWSKQKQSNLGEADSDSTLSAVSTKMMTDYDEWQLSRCNFRGWQDAIVLPTDLNMTYTLIAAMNILYFETLKFYQREKNLLVWVIST